MIDDQESESQILDSIDRFLEAEVRPVVHQLEHDDIYPAQIVEKMKELGLFGAIIAPEYGGLGLSTRIYAKIIERISAVWMSISGIVNSHLIMASAVQRHGTEEQKRHYLPKFASAELRGGIGLALGLGVDAIGDPPQRLACQLPRLLDGDLIESPQPVAGWRSFHFAIRVKTLRPFGGEQQT